MGPQRLHAASFLQVPADLEQGAAPPIPKRRTKSGNNHIQDAHTARVHVPADRADKCDCDMAPALHTAPSTPLPEGSESHFQSWKLQRREERRRPKGHDVPQPATSEAKALRGRRSRRTTEFPDCLPLFLCARVSARILVASRAFVQARTVLDRYSWRRLQAGTHAERGAHGLVSRADET
jgi:hypothetical protein